MQKPVILGVLNVSPESKIKDAVAITKRDILARARFLKKNGTDFIDLGARSTSNRKQKVDEKTELKRLIPALRLLKSKGYKVSIDTWSSKNAIECLEEGADMMNFTSSQYNSNMLKLIKKSNSWLIITYMPYKNAYNMDKAKPAKLGLNRIIKYFKIKMNMAKKYGIKKIIIDPNSGIMHKKIKSDIKANYQAYLIENLHRFKELGCKVIMHVPTGDSEYSRYAMASIVLQNKPDFIRTHYPNIIKKFLKIRLD